MWLYESKSDGTICQKSPRNVKRVYSPAAWKTPSFPTLHRIIKQLDVEKVIKRFNDWMEQYQVSERIAIDGKSIRSTVTDAGKPEQNFVSLVSFMCLFLIN